MMILESCVTFTGNNTFLNNAALIGGSLYFLMSVVILKGTNMFEDNYTFVRSEFRTLNCIYCNNNCQKEVTNSGGAIYSNYSTFIINSDFSIFTNNFAHTNGGAVFAQDGNIVIQDSTVLFDRNLARSEGGAMCLFFVTLILDGNISFINNTAYAGGALSLYVTELFFLEESPSPESFDNAAINFCWNVKKNGGFIWSYSHDIPVFTDIMEFDASIAVEYDSFYRNILPLIKIVKLLGE